MTQHDVHAVFPPREGLRVGDVYVQPAGSRPGLLAREGRLVPSDLWAGRLAVAEAPRSEDLAPLPEFTGLAVAGSDLIGLLPIEALALVFGATWRAEHEVSVRVAAAGSLALPAQELISAAVAEDGRLRPPVVADLGAWMHAETVRGSDQLAASPRLLDLGLVSRVFETRAIDIEISTRHSPAAGLLAAVAGSARAEAASESSSAAWPPSQLAAALNARLDRLGVEITRGSFRFTLASENSVSMHREFSTPVVVGCQFLALRVDPVSGALARPLAVP